jgi:hypothetical protein
MYLQKEMPTPTTIKECLSQQATGLNKRLDTLLKMQCAQSAYPAMDRPMRRRTEYHVDSAVRERAHQSDLQRAEQIGERIQSVLDHVRRDFNKIKHHLNTYTFANSTSATVLSSSTPGIFNSLPHNVRAAFIPPWDTAHIVVVAVDSSSAHQLYFYDLDYNEDPPAGVTNPVQAGAGTSYFSQMPNDAELAIAHGAGTQLDAVYTVAGVVYFNCIISASSGFRYKFITDYNTLDAILPGTADDESVTDGLGSSPFNMSAFFAFRQSDLTVLSDWDGNGGWTRRTYGAGNQQFNQLPSTVQAVVYNDSGNHQGVHVLSEGQHYYYDKALIGTHPSMSLNSTAVVTAYNIATTTHVAQTDCLNTLATATIDRREAWTSELCCMLTVVRNYINLQYFSSFRLLSNIPLKCESRPLTAAACNGCYRPLFTFATPAGDQLCRSSSSVHVSNPDLQIECMFTEVVEACTTASSNYILMADACSDATFQLIKTRIVTKMAEIRAAQLQNDEELSQLRSLREVSDCNESYHSNAVGTLTQINEQALKTKYEVGKSLLCDIDAIYKETCITKQTFFGTKT